MLSKTAELNTLVVFFQKKKKKKILPFGYRPLNIALSLLNSCKKWVIQCCSFDLHKYYVEIGVGSSHIRGKPSNLAITKYVANNILH